MNIFFLHWDPSICAKWHVDKHVVKMILESIQLLCSVHWMTESTYKPPYKLTHKNHPCAKWARESIDNYKWLVILTSELCKEYTHRYGKIHKCQSMIRDLVKNLPPIPEKGFTYPARAMPVDYKRDDPTASYKIYYKNDKQRMFSWKKRDEPDWIHQDVEEDPNILEIFTTKPE